MPDSDASRCFPPVLTPSCHTLVLGSMPSVESLQRGEYYAHPRNAFWDIVEELLGIPRTREYPERLRDLAACGVALWDVLAQCRRAGSLDSAIRAPVPNDFSSLLADGSAIRRVCVNGGKAHELFTRHVIPTLSSGATLEIIRLPSTSPANARLSFAQKLDAWRILAAGGAAR